MNYGYIPDVPKKVVVVDSEDKVGQAVEYLLRFDMLGFDVETYHSFDRHKPAFDPCDGARMRLAQFATPSGVAFVFDLYRVSKSFLKYMFPNRYLCVIQNAKFELKYLMYELGVYEFGPMFDTMIAEQLLSYGRVAGKEFIPVALDRIAWRRLGVELPKDEQASEWYRYDLSKSQIEYAARDAMIVLPIYQQQRDELVSSSQVRVAELEFDVTQPIAWMENNGFRMNANAWTKVCDDTAEEIKDIKSELWDLLGIQGTLFGEQSINLDSKPQVMDAFKRRGVSLPINDEGKVTLSNKLLKAIEGRRDVDLYVKYVKLAKRLQSFGYNWADKINPYTGRIHCQLKQIGAETGRMSAAGPNLMQIPKENLYRNCFEAEEGWVLIDNDYSQCELRILAEYCRDPNLLEAFDKGYDLHRYSAHLIYQCAMDAVTDVMRSVAKNLNFGIVYGIGVTKFANDAHIPVEQAQEIMDYYLKKAYPAMGSWLDGRAKQVLYNMQATTMTGRIRKYSGDLSDSQFKSEVQRNAKNLPIQGTNADITKLALTQVYREIVKRGWVEDVRLVLPIHDEIILESKPAYAAGASDLMTQEMLSAERQFLRRVPSVVDGSITTLWFKSPDPDNLSDAADLDKAARLLLEAQ